MTFINPWMLTGLVAVGVPVLFHLLKRKRSVPKRWAAFRLLAATQATAKRAQIEHWLLLALRMAIFALLVLAFARPGGYLGLLAGGTSKWVVVALDTSASMAVKLNDAQKFTLARDRVLSHLDRVSLAQGTVLLFSDRPREPFAGFTGDAAAIREAVERATVSAGGTDGNAALRRATALLRSAPEKERVVLLYSDFRKNGWDLDDLARLDEELRGQDLRIALVGLRGEGGSPDDQAVAATELDTDVVTANQPVSLRITFKNWARQARTRRFAVWVDGEKRHEQETEIPAAKDAAAGEREESIPLSFPSEGYHAGQVTLEHDEMESDDTRWFAVQVVPRLRVLVVDGDPQLDPAGSETFFLARLLSPAVSGNVDPTVVPVWNFAKTPLAGYDAVVLANVDTVAPERVSELRDFAQAGGGLVWFPGDKVFPEDFVKAFTGAAPAGDTGEARIAAVPEGIFPGYPTEAVGDVADLAGARRLDPSRADWSHPLVRRFKGTEIAAARFRRTMRFKELDATSVPLRYDDGSPALLERAFGAGRVIVFTSACDAAWNDMMLTGSTAGLALQAVYYASGRGRNDALNLTVGVDVSLRFGLDLLGKEVRITRPGGSMTRLSSRATRRGECVAKLADARDAGLYAFEVDSGPRGAVAVNVDPREPDPTELDPAKIVEALHDVDVTVDNEDLLTGNKALVADGWLLLVLAALAVAGGELYLANKRL